MGDGEGERDGQELMERRSEAWEAVSEGGWMKTAGAIPVSLRASPIFAEMLGIPSEGSATRWTGIAFVQVSDGTGV